VTEIRAIQTDRAPTPRGPYSQAIRAGGTVYVAGQVPLDPATNQPIAGSIEEQARRTLENMRAILEEAGSSLDRVVKATIFLADINDFAAVNGVYAEYFKERPPARSTVAGALPAGFRLMIDAVAVD
jgi:2-iminobutanoate/2-iminopropanoate deaminase